MKRSIFPFLAVFALLAFPAFPDVTVLAVPAGVRLVNLGFDLMRMAPKGKVLFVCYGGESELKTIEYFDSSVNRWVATSKDLWEEGRIGGAGDGALIVAGHTPAAEELVSMASWAKKKLTPDSRRYHEIANAFDSVRKLSKKQWQTLGRNHGIYHREIPVSSRYGKPAPAAKKKHDAVLFEDKSLIPVKIDTALPAPVAAPSVKDKAETPKADDVKAETPAVPAAAVESPRVETPVVAAPAAAPSVEDKAETPKADDVKVETPAVPAAAGESPKVEAPVVPAPVAAPPVKDKAETPKVDAPLTEATAVAPPKVDDGVKAAAPAADANEEARKALEKALDAGNAQERSMTVLDAIRKAEAEVALLKASPDAAKPKSERAPRPGYRVPDLPVTVIEAETTKK